MTSAASALKLSMQLAQDKAATAVSYSMPTHDWFNFIKTIRRSCTASPLRRSRSCSAAESQS